MGSMAISTDAASIAGAAAQSPVLRVIVENLFYPVTLDVLHQVLQFNRCTMFLKCPDWIILFLSSCRETGPPDYHAVYLLDFLQVWDCAEDHHLHKEQPVPGSHSVCRQHDGPARQTGKTGAASLA